MSVDVVNRVLRSILFLSFWFVIAILIAPPLAILWKGGQVYWSTFDVNQGAAAAFLSFQYADEFLSGLKNGVLYALGGASIVVIFCIVIVLSRVLSDTVETHYISWFFAYFALLAILIPPWSVALSVDQIKLLLTNIGGWTGIFADSAAYVLLIMAMFAMPFGLYFFMLRTIGEDEQYILGWRETGAGLNKLHRLASLVHSLRHLYLPATIAALFTASLVSFGDGGRTVRLLTKEESSARLFEEVFRSASDEGLWVFASIVVCLAALCFSVVWYLLEGEDK